MKIIVTISLIKPCLVLKGLSFAQDYELEHHTISSWFRKVKQCLPLSSHTPYASWPRASRPPPRRARASSPASPRRPLPRRRSSRHSKRRKSLNRKYSLNGLAWLNGFAHLSRPHEAQSHTKKNRPQTKKTQNSYL